MKKLFTLLTLLVAIVTGAQAQSAADTYLDLGWTDAANHDVSYTIDQAGWSKSGTAYSWDATTKTLVVNAYNAYSSKSKQKWITSPSSGSTSVSGGWAASDPFKGSSFWGTTTSASTVNTSRSTIFMIKGITSVSVYAGTDNVARQVVMTVSEGSTEVETKTSNAEKNGTDIITVDNLNASTTYTITVTGNNSSNARFFEIAFVGAVAPAGPSITTQPQSASYASGQTIAALTVEATASAGTLSYQWYSCDDADKTNAAAISGETNASYTPTAAGFYYVTVTDDNGSVESDVAQITISAAEAPTINVTGAPAEAVKVGTEVILTATATGTPTPTITWYDGNDASVGTGDTFTVPTDAADTYEYYAVASNGVGTDATSATQTIVVKEQVAKPTITPNGAYFQDSQEVTIESATEDAVVQYSVDNGATWTTMLSKVITVNETTTVQAKATKEGMIDSEVATATFNKVELVDQTEITGATTWDWSTVTNSSAVDFSETALNGADVLYANIAAYGFTAVSGLGNETALLFNGQRAYNNANGSKHCQGNYLKFITTVPGNVTVEYANTGSNAARTVNVNGQNGTKSSTANNSYQSESFDVNAGTVTIKGVQVSDDADKMLRIRKVVFTPTVSVSISAAGAASFSSTEALDFSNVEGVTAYSATMKTDNYVHLEEVTAVPAEAGVILKGAEGDYNVPVATGEVSALNGNLLVGTATAAYTVTQNDYDNSLVYKYVKSNTTGLVGFQKAKTDNVIAVGRAYLKLTQEQASRLAGFADEEGIVTGISSIENAGVDATAPAYNLAGQKVSKSYKGIVIQNGKKVVK